MPKRSLALALVTMLFGLLVLAGCARPQAGDAAAAPAGAQELTIQAEGAWAQHTALPGEQRPIQGVTSAIYLRMVNTGPEADALVAVRADVARSAQLHRTTIEGDVMRMEILDRIEIPASGSAELKRGSDHIMLMGLTRNLIPGDRFLAVLVLEKAGEVTVEVEVREG